MSKKDYVLIAAVLREQRHNQPGELPDVVIDAVASALADALRRDNARFDRSRFLAAAGVRE